MLKDSKSLSTFKYHLKDGLKILTKSKSSSLYENPLKDSLKKRRNEIYTKSWKGDSELNVIQEPTYYTQS